MSTKLDASFEKGCLLLIGIWFVLGALAVLAKMLALVLLIALACVAVVLVVTSLIDMIRRRQEAKELLRRKHRSIHASGLPAFSRRKNKLLIDSVLWEMMCRYIELKRRTLPKGRAEELQRLREEIDREEQIFELWKHANLIDAVDEPFNRSLLTEVFNILHARFRRDWDSKTAQTMGLLGATILAKIASEPTIRPRWFFTQWAASIITFGQVEPPAKEIQPNEETIRLYYRDAERFRQFMDQYFFEIMGELGAYELELSRVHERLGQEQKLPLARPALVQPSPPIKIPAKLEDHEAKKRQERERREKQLLEEKRAREEKEAEERAREYEHRAEKRHEEELERKYVGGMSFDVLFEQFKRRNLRFAEDIEALIQEQTQGDAAAYAQRQQALIQRHEFRIFWLKHKGEVIRRHYARMQAEELCQERTAREETASVRNRGTCRTGADCLSERARADSCREIC